MISILTRESPPMSDFVVLIPVFTGCHHTELVAASAASLFDRRSCEAAIVEWSNKENLAVNKELQLAQHQGMKILDLLFFLHIPRTGGRTYHYWYRSLQDFKLYITVLGLITRSM